MWNPFYYYFYFTAVNIDFPARLLALSGKFRVTITVHFLLGSLDF